MHWTLIRFFPCSFLQLSGRHFLILCSWWEKSQFHTWMFQFDPIKAPTFILLVLTCPTQLPPHACLRGLHPMLKKSFGISSELREIAGQRILRSREKVEYLDGEADRTHSFWKLDCLLKYEVEAFLSAAWSCNIDCRVVCILYLCICPCPHHICWEGWGDSNLCKY